MLLWQGPSFWWRDPAEAIKEHRVVVGHEFEKCYQISVITTFSLLCFIHPQLLFMIPPTTLHTAGTTAEHLQFLSILTNPNTNFKPPHFRPPLRRTLRQGTTQQIPYLLAHRPYLEIKIFGGIIMNHCRWTFNQISIPE